MGAVTCLVAAASCASSHRTGTGSGATASGTPTLDTAYLLQVQAAVLVDAKGYALYIFAPDAQRRVTCITLCAGSWPPLFAASGSHGAAVAGPGVNAKLIGSDPDPAGGRVVTYQGWPLYTYDADVQPGIATGQGIDDDGGYWFLIRPDGTPVDPTGDGTPPVPTT